MDFNFSHVRQPFYASNDFASVHTQEFDTENMCQFAAKAFKQEFETFKDINAKAICVKK